MALVFYQGQVGPTSYYPYGSTMAADFYAYGMWAPLNMDPGPGLEVRITIEGSATSYSYDADVYGSATGVTMTDPSNVNGVTFGFVGVCGAYGPGDVFTFNVFFEQILTNVASVQSQQFVSTEGATSSADWKALKPLPTEAGHSGEYLTTDGENLSWHSAPLELPSQSGHSGEYLTTDGTTPAWQAVGTGITWTNVPGATGATGYTGQAAFDDNYIYVCIGTDNWKRSPLSGWT